MPNEPDPTSTPDDNADPYADVPDPSPKVDTDVPGKIPSGKPRAAKGSLLVTDEVVFGDLPPEGGGRGARPGIWVERLQPLLTKPEQWARVVVFSDTKTADRTASNLRAGKMRLPDTPEGHFQFASRINQPEQGQSAIWARYVPGPRPLVGPDAEHATHPPKAPVAPPTPGGDPAAPPAEPRSGAAAAIPGVLGDVRNPEEPVLVKTQPPAPSSPAPGAGGLAGKS